MAQLNKQLNVLLIPETKLPPLSRANLRLFNLGQTLLKKGYTVHIVSPSDWPHKLESSKKFNGILIHQFPGFNSLMYSKMRIFVRFYHLLATIVYSLLMHSKFDFDVIHSWHPLASFASVYIGKIIKRPVITDYTDFYSDIAKYDSPLMVPFFNYIEKKGWMMSTKIVVVSEEMKKILLEKVRDNAFMNKIFVVPDGVDAERFNLNINGRKIRNKLNFDSCPVCIYHGDIKYFDGVDILIYAFKKVTEEILNAKLLILGGGGPYFNESIIPLIKRLNLKQSIVLIAWIDHIEVPEYISTADVGVMPLRNSLNNNTFYSFKLFEYWGMGKPVVVTNLKTISTIVKNKVNGMLVQPEDVGGLSKALIYLLSNPEEAKMMGLKGRKLVETEFNWNSLMEKEAKLYDEFE